MIPDTKQTPLCDIPFVDWPHDSRMMARATMEGAGANYFAYGLDGVQVAVEVGCEKRLREVCERLNLRVDSQWQFPLGSDKPPGSFRHGSRSYGGKENCWLYWHLTPNGIAAK